MRISLVVFLLVILISSCGRMPYEQWTSSLNNEKATLNAQKLEAQVIQGPDQRLYQGVLSATRKKEAEPYPELTLLVSEIEVNVDKLNTGSNAVLEKLDAYKSKMGENSISTIGPEFTDYTSLLSTLNEQAALNQKSLKVILTKDQLFDSLCNAYDIREITAVKQDIDLSTKLSTLQDRLDSAIVDYDVLRRDITSQEDQKSSMTKLNDMRQIVRQIEDELAKFSSLATQVQTRFKETRRYQGPFIDYNLEINQALEIEARLTRLLDEFEGMIEEY